MNIQVVRKFPQLKSKTLFSQCCKSIIPQRKSTKFAKKPQQLKTNPISSFKFSKWIDVQNRKSPFSTQTFPTVHNLSTTPANPIEFEPEKAGPRLRERLGKPIAVSNFIEALDKFFTEYCTPKDLGYRWKTWDPRMHSVEESHGLAPVPVPENENISEELELYDENALDSAEIGEKDILDEEGPPPEVREILEEGIKFGKNGKNYTPWTSAYNRIFPETLVSLMDIREVTLKKGLNAKLYPHNDRHTFPYGIVPVAIHKSPTNTFLNVDVLKELEGLSNQDIRTIKGVLSSRAVPPSLQNLEQLQPPLPPRPITEDEVFTEADQIAVKELLFNELKTKYPKTYQNVGHLIENGSDEEISRSSKEDMLTVFYAVYGLPLDPLTEMLHMLSAQKDSDVLFLLYRSLNELNFSEILMKILNLKQKDYEALKKKYIEVHPDIIKQRKLRVLDEKTIQNQMKLFDEIRSATPEKKAEFEAKQSTRLFIRQVVVDFYRNWRGTRFDMRMFDTDRLMADDTLLIAITKYLAEAAHKYPFILEYLFARNERAVLWLRRHEDNFERHFREYREKIYQARLRNDRVAYANLQTELEVRIQAEAGFFLERLERDNLTSVTDLELDKRVDGKYDPKEILMDNSEHYFRLNEEQQADVQKYFIGLETLLAATIKGNLAEDFNMNLEQIASFLKVATLLNEEHLYEDLFRSLAEGMNEKHQDNQIATVGLPNRFWKKLEASRDDPIGKLIWEMITLPEDKRETLCALPVKKLQDIAAWLEGTAPEFRLEEVLKSMNPDEALNEVEKSTNLAKEVFHNLGKVPTESVEIAARLKEIPEPVINMAKKANDALLSYGSKLEKKTQIMAFWEKKADDFTLKIQSKYPKIWSKINEMRVGFGNKLQKILGPRELLFGILLREAKVGDQLIQPFKEVLLEVDLEDLGSYYNLIKDLQEAEILSFEAETITSIKFKGILRNAVIEEEERAGEEAVKTFKRLTQEFLRGLKNYVEKVKDFTPEMKSSQAEDLFQILSIRDTVGRLANQVTEEDPLPQSTDYNEFKSAVFYWDQGILSIRRYRTYFTNPSILRALETDQENSLTDQMKDPEKKLRDLLKDQQKAEILVDWYKSYLSARNSGDDKAVDKTKKEFEKISGLPFNTQHANSILFFVQTKDLPDPTIHPDSVNFDTIYRSTDYGHLYIDIQNFRLPANWIGAFKSVQWPKFLPSPVEDYTQIEEIESQPPFKQDDELKI